MHTQMFCSWFHCRWEQTPAQPAGLQEPPSRTDLTSPVPALLLPEQTPLGGSAPSASQIAFGTCLLPFCHCTGLLGAGFCLMQAEKHKSLWPGHGPGRRMRGAFGAFWECSGSVPRAARLPRYREPLASLRIKLFITKSNFIVNWFKVILQLCACISYFGKNGYFP